jgi:hypothetical protein
VAALFIRKQSPLKSNPSRISSSFGKISESQPSFAEECLVWNRLGSRLAAEDMVLLTMRAYVGVILGWKLLWTILTSKFRFEEDMVGDFELESKIKYVRKRKHRNTSPEDSVFK